MTLNSDGAPYVNMKSSQPGQDPSSRGLSPDTQRSIQRNATSEIDTHFADSGCGGGGSSRGAIHVAERGTAYAKPIDCKFGALPPAWTACLRKGHLCMTANPCLLPHRQISRPRRRRAAGMLTAGQHAFCTSVRGLQCRIEFGSAAPGPPTPRVSWVQGDDEARPPADQSLHVAQCRCGGPCRPHCCSERISGHEGAPIERYPREQGRKGRQERSDDAERDGV